MRSAGRSARRRLRASKARAFHHRDVLAGDVAGRVAMQLVATERNPAVAGSGLQGR
ncbi:MAG: hypothetical protein QM777_21545 [Pseudorhodoferax sp.]